MMRSSLQVVEGEVDTSFIDTIRINFSVFSNKGYIAVLAITFVALLGVQLHRYYEGARLVKKEFFKYIILLVLPIGWYMVTTNHATEHYWMTWRNAALVILIIFAAVLEGVKEDSFIVK